jgi:hypothetical protein
MPPRQPNNKQTNNKQKPTTKIKGEEVADLPKFGENGGEPVDTLSCCGNGNTVSNWLRFTAIRPSTTTRSPSSAWTDRDVAGANQEFHFTSLGWYDHTA